MELELNQLLERLIEVEKQQNKLAKEKRNLLFAIRDSLQSQGIPWVKWCEANLKKSGRSYGSKDFNIGIFEEINGIPLGTYPMRLGVDIRKLKLFKVGGKGHILDPYQDWRNLAKGAKERAIQCFSLAGEISVNDSPSASDIREAIAILQVSNSQNKAVANNDNPHFEVEYYEKVISQKDQQIHSLHNALIAKDEALRAITKKAQTLEKQMEKLYERRVA